MTTRHGPQSQGLDGLHRTGSAVLGTALWVFGVLGFANQLGFFSTGSSVLGMSTNGLLSAVSLVFGTVLVGAAIRGGRLASTVSVSVGVLFIVSGVAHVLIMNSALNVLSFRMSNVVFSLVAGLVLLVLGAYGRFTGRLPDDNPYRGERTHDVEAEATGDRRQMLPEGAAEVSATVEMAEAERAVAAGAGTDGQRRGVESMDHERDTDDRRAAWREHSRSGDAAG